LIKHFQEEQINIRRFKEYVKEHVIDSKDNFYQLGFELNEVGMKSDNHGNYKIFMSKTDIGKTLYINNTVIVIRSMERVKPENLYEEFLNSLIDEKNILLTLFGLEMRNIYRKTSAFIGMEMENIDELAFFYHYRRFAKGDEPKEIFYEFLRKIWTEHASFQFIENGSELLNSLEDYIRIKGIYKQLDKFIEDKELLIHGLSNLNMFYNRQNIIRCKNDIIRFGDIFYCSELNESNYLICITSHCDCLYPEKINNQYFFSEGEKIGSLKKSLRRVENDYISYIKDPNSKKLICIDWLECKPFSLYLSNNKINEPIKVYYRGKTITIKYISTLKENFVQRIANKAFIYPMRVGINMAKLSLIDNGMNDDELKKKYDFITSLESIEDYEKYLFFSSDYHVKDISKLEKSELKKMKISEERIDDLFEELRYEELEKVEE